MEKLVFKKADPNQPRHVTWPCKVQRAQDGGTFAEVQLNTKFELVPTAKVVGMPDYVIYDLTVRGFPDLPGAEGVASEEVIQSFRDDPEVLVGVARGYFDMINGRIPKN